MHPSFQQAQFTPWNYPIEKLDHFELQNSHNINQQSLENNTNNQKSKSSFNKILIKKQKLGNYSNILPKVYEKGKELLSNTKSQKTQRNKLQIALKTVNKNDLIIRVPQDPLQLPKVPIEHPIKHSTKLLKRNHKTADNRSDPRNQKISQKNGNLTEFKARVSRSSIDLIHNRSYADIRKKISIYQEQIVKKCSLKNLKIYNEEEQDADVIKKLLRKKQVNQKVCVAKEKKHILDRILSRLQ